MYEINEYCPKCHEKVWYKEESSGGDGIVFCKKCKWVESFDGSDEALKELSKKNDKGDEVN